MWAFVIPYIFNPDQANLGAKTAFIFGGLSIFCTAYLFFCHPETSGRSYEELDEMFMKHVPARKFRTYQTESEAQGQDVKRRLSSAGEIFT
jgi:MFS transporter, SP family, general alpha glucoside:H+ symporter